MAREIGLSLSFSPGFASHANMLNRLLTDPSLRGILCVLTAGATFSTSDMMIKTLSGAYASGNTGFFIVIDVGRSKSS